MYVSNLTYGSNSKLKAYSKWSGECQHRNKFVQILEIENLKKEKDSHPYTCL